MQWSKRKAKPYKKNCSLAGEGWYPSNPATLNEKMYNLGLEVTIQWLGFVTLRSLPFPYLQLLSVHTWCWHLHICSQLLSVAVKSWCHSIAPLSPVTTCHQLQVAPPCASIVGASQSQHACPGVNEPGMNISNEPLRVLSCKITCWQNSALFALSRMHLLCLKVCRCAAAWIRLHKVSNEWGPSLVPPWNIHLHQYWVNACQPA